MQNASQDRQSEIFSTAMKTNEFVQLERNHDDDYTEQTKPDANRSLINSFSFVAVTNSGWTRTRDNIGYNKHTKALDECKALPSLMSALSHTKISSRGFPTAIHAHTSGYSYSR